MRIALLHNLPSGGAMRTLQQQVRRLVGPHEVDGYTLSSADLEFLDHRSDIQAWHHEPYQPLPLATSPFGRANAWIRVLDVERRRRAWLRLARLVEMGSYDAAFVHPCQYGNAPPISGMLQIPVLLYLQETLRTVYDPPVASKSKRSTVRHVLDFVDPGPNLQRRAMREADRAGVLAADRVLVNSRHVRREAQRVYGIDAQVSYHGVDAEIFRPGAGEREGFVLSVGALREEKGFHFLVDCLGRIAPQQRPELVVVSNAVDPRAAKSLELLAAQRGVGLTLERRIDDRRLISYYQRAALVAYAPYHEPFGLVPLEAMACETPVVGVREGGVIETVVDGETGWLVDRDANAFAVAIQEALAGSATRRERGRAGRAHVLRSWSWDRAMEVLEGHLLAVAGRS